MQFLKLLRTILQSKKFWLILIVISCLYVFINVKVFRYQSIYNQDTTNFIGTISKIKKTDYGYSLTIKTPEKLIVYVKECPYKLGDKVFIEGNLEIPSNNTILNTFNYKEYLYHNKIFYTLNSNKIILLKKNQNLIYKLKDKLLTYLDTFKSKNYLKSFILGDTSYLGNDLYHSYQINGICHILAIGSLHLTFLSYLILTTLKKFRVGDTVSHLILFLIIFAYLLLTDYQVPLLRVYFYMIFKFLNQKLKLNLKPIELFLLTISLTLFINPFYIYHKGFLYSYSISFILIINKDNLKGNFFKKTLLISLISFLYSLPFNIYFNYEINILSIFYNLIYVPIFNLVIFPVSLLTLIFPFLDNIFYFIMEILNNLSYYLNTFTLGIIILKKISWIILILYLLMLTYIIKGLFSNKKKRLILLIIVFLIHFYINDIFPNNFYMMIDVGQGDSSLLYSNNKAILIDTGGLYNSNVVSKTIEMLKSLGIREINYLILTHGDYDHMGDSIYLVNNFKVDKVIFNNDSYNNLESKLIKVLDSKKINYYQNLKELNIPKVKLSFLNTTIYDNENDNSNVLYFKYQNLKFLLMGDASSFREKDILVKYKLEDIDFLKVGHHGSDTSTSLEFIETINPKYSLISVGKNNRYGHPKASILDILKSSKIYRTDINGSIWIKFKKNGYLIKTYAP